MGSPSSVWGSLWAKWPTVPGRPKYDWNSAIYPYELTIECERRDA
jgi:hypothetical protein